MKTAQPWYNNTSAFMAFVMTFSTYNHIYVHFFAEFEYEIQHICYVPKKTGQRIR